VSHPVRAWNIGSARAFSRPNPAAISCALVFVGCHHDFTRLLRMHGDDLQQLE